MIEEAKSGNGDLEWQYAAAIGPYAIVDQTSLPLMQKNVEDHHDNTTRCLDSHNSHPQHKYYLRKFE